MFYLKDDDCVIDLMEAYLGFGKIINIEAHHGEQPYTMLTVDFGHDQVFDRYPNEVMKCGSMPTAKYQQRIEDVVDMKDLPSYLSDEIYETAIKADAYDHIDYMDGDFKFPVDLTSDHNWLRLLKPLLSPEVIERNKLAIKFYQ